MQQPLYGLIGGKLGHSYSKIIHEKIADYTYELLPLPTEAEARTFMEKRAFAAINVTIPYKQFVIPYCDVVDPKAQAIGAVNTIVNRDEKLYGYNTDYAGFAYLAGAHGVDFAGKTVLILGTGGTHSTVTAVCRDGGAKKILTASRTGKGDALLYSEAMHRPDVQIIVNTTPCGMFPNVGQCLIDPKAFPALEAVLDVVEANNTVYAVLENLGGTPLEQWLENRPAPVQAEEACAMLRPVFEGVAAMHKAGLVHRGICPENIRVMSDGRCRLAGYATVGLRTAGSGLHEQLYEGYSAPEQYTTAEFEGRYTDEYSLAAVFYRMVCGQAPMPAAQRVVSDSNPRARTVEPAVPAYVSDVLQLGLRLKVMERIQTVPQLYQALSSKEYTAELTRTMKPETPMHPARTEQSGQGREHLLSLKGLLAGILILLSVLILLTLWGIVSSKEEQTPSSEPSSEAASSEEMKPQNLVPNFVGIDYEQIKNNREYTSMYLFRAVLEYSDTVPSGQIIRQEPEAGEMMENGEVIQIVVSQGPEKVEMPKIVGASQDKAIEILSSRGLVASCFMVVNDGSYATGCVVSASEEEGAMVTVGTVITVYIAADPSVQITATPEEPAATEPTTPETPPEGSTEPEYDTN